MTILGAGLRLDRSNPWGRRKPGPDEMLIHTSPRAHPWKQMLEEGRYRSVGELAEAEKVSRSFVNRMLRLTLLVPDIVEAILDGRQPKGTQLEGLTKPMPSEWGEQRKLLI